MVGLLAGGALLAGQEPPGQQRAPYPDRWVVTRPTPDPPAVGEWIVGERRDEIVESLSAGGWRALEERFEALEERAKRDVRWEEELFWSYMAFHGPREGDRMIRELDRWVAESDRPFVARVARSFYWRARALEWERERWADRDPERAGEVRDDFSERAELDARWARALHEDRLGAHLALLHARTLYNWNERTETVVRDALARYPSSYHLQEMAIWAVRPRSNGSEEQMRAAVDAALARRDANPRLSELASLVAAAEVATLWREGRPAMAVRSGADVDEDGAGWRFHYERAIAFAQTRDPVRSLEATDRAYRAAPARWEVLDHRAQLLQHILQLAPVLQKAEILEQALQDQNDALALQPYNLASLERRDGLAALHGRCDGSTVRCLDAFLFMSDPGEPREAGPWWSEVLRFAVAVPVTLLLVLAEGSSWYLLPVPALAVAMMGWSFLAWWRHRFWTPGVVHLMAGLAFLLLVGINVAWVRAGGSMWTQRYVVICVATLVPYVIYLVLGGPRYMEWRGRVPERPGRAAVPEAGPDAASREG